MSAGDHLSGPQFHGARMQIDDTHVRPPSVTGVPAISSSRYSSGPGRPAHTDVAFSTPSEAIAWNYARVVGQHKDDPINNDPDPKYRSRVYKVAPAHDQHLDFPGDSEIQSPTGFKIIGQHDSEVGATGTFPTHNWNAFKPRKSGSTFVSHMDMNQSFMQGDRQTKPKPEPHVEVKGQMNLLTGRTVEEHDAFVKTPGFDLHLNMSKQFSQADVKTFAKDPTVKTLRRKQPYHDVDEQVGMVH